MFSLSTKLAEKLSIGGDPLYVFAPTQLIDGEWVTPFKTNDWDEALSYMDELSVELRKRKKISTADIEEDIDFAA